MLQVTIQLIKALLTHPNSFKELLLRYLAVEIGTAAAEHFATIPIMHA